MSAFSKRFQFKRQQTTDSIRRVELDHVNGSGESSDSKRAIDDKGIGLTTAVSVQEEEAVQRRLSLFKQENAWDPNLPNPNDTFADIDDTIHDHNVEGEHVLVDRLLENSPYPEVRAAVRNYDVEFPASTIRAWVIGMILTTLGSGLNALFTLRAPSISITSVVAQLVAYPMGVGWSWVMPNKQFNTFGVKWNLNPGPFNFKEHTLIVIMANASFGGGAGYFTDTIMAQQGFYGQDFGWGFGILLALSTQCTGFGIAGLMRRWLVEPAAMIWPSNLVSCAFMYALHDHSKTDPAKANGWKIGRYRYFYYVFLGSFIWYWFPGWIAQFLSIFAWVTWIAPNNIVVNQVFGGNTGLAFGALTFDWTQVTGYIFSPLISPFHAIANTGIAVVFWIWIVTPALHYTHHWYSDYLPISDSRSYNNMGTPYNVHKILTPEFTLDIKLYEAYSPLFLSTTFALLYGLSFAAIAAVIVHTILFNGKTILLRARQSREDMDDVHTKMMKKYPVTPDWWYLVLLVVMLGLSFATIYGWPTHLTWWALIIAFLIAGVWILPIGMIAATTNITLGLNVFTEYIIGYMLPGRPVAMMLFKTYGYITMTQGLTFVQDMKLGHYLKVPQRSMFWGQLVATIWSCLVQLAVVRWGLTNIRNVCTSLAPNGFNCPNGRVFFNASVIWGLIGPARIFSGDATYAGLQYFWIAGAIAPLFVYFGARMFPKSPIRYINMPIIFGGIGALPPATPLNYLSWVAVGTLFNKIIRNRYRGWWMRFNYITSAGLDTGLAICTIIIIACLTLTNATPPQWWGNLGALNTTDANDAAIKIGPGVKYGPATW